MAGAQAVACMHDHIFELTTDNRQGWCSKEKWNSGLFLSHTHKGKKTGNFTSQRTNRTCKCLLGSVHVCLISTCVVRGCQGGTHSAKSAKELQKSYSLYNSRYIKGMVGIYWGKIPSPEQRTLWGSSSLIYGLFGFLIKLNCLFLHWGNGCMLCWCFGVVNNHVTQETGS